MDKGQRRTTVIVLSDFIEEDRDINFKTDARLSTRITAKSLAQELTHNNSIKLQNVHLMLGTIRSKDLGKLPKARREGIEALWIELGIRSGAHVDFVTDGIGLINSALSNDPVH